MGSWNLIEGSLEQIDHDGPVLSRYPPDLVKPILDQYTSEGEIVLDPFAGYATTLTAAHSMSRVSFGFEPAPDVFEFATSLLGDSKSATLFNDFAENLQKYHVPMVDLVVSSPPFDMFFQHCDGDKVQFEAKVNSLFSIIKNTMKPNAMMVLELVNKRDSLGNLYPHGFLAAVVLSEILKFQGESVVCNKGGVEVTPGFTHSVLVHFKNSEP